MKNQIKVTQRELAIYLQVEEQTVSNYKKTPVGKRKLHLMLKGLLKLKEEKLQRENYKTSS